VVGQVTSDGVVKEYPLMTNPSGALSIVLGPDGNLWFTQPFLRVGRISVDGVIVEYNVGCVASEVDPGWAPLMPSAITVGPDGALWFTDSKFNYLGRITTTGEITYHPYSKPQAGCGQASSIVTGPDGNLWFTCSDPNIYRFTP